MPYKRNPYFMGREEVFEQLRATLGAGSAAALTQPCAISGMGGVGKTQTAVEYAYRYRDAYEAVLWVRAESDATISASFSEIGRILDLPETREQGPSGVADAVRRWLRERRDWLLIMDNADYLSIAHGALPAGLAGHVLFTTRATDLQGLARPIWVRELSAREGAEFLLRRVEILPSGESFSAIDEHERTASIALSEQLGGLPLALEQAAAYVGENDSSYVDYLAAYRKRHLGLLEESRPELGDYQHTVRTTWTMNFDAVLRESEASAELLYVSTFLHPDSIPYEILAGGAAKLGPILAKALEGAHEDPSIVDAILRPLTQYSLIHVDPDSRSYSIHRLVQSVVHDRLGRHERRLWAERIVRALNAAFPIPWEIANWPLCDKLLPHARIAEGLIGRYDMEFEEAAKLLNLAGWHLIDRALYAEAERFYKRGLAIRIKTLGAESPYTGASLNNLASLYKTQGRFAEAEAMLLRALVIEEKHLGAEHTEFARCLNNLAGLYKDQEKYAEAEPLYRRALSIRQKAHGESHPDIANDLGSLAELYRLQGNYNEAEVFHKRALEILKNAFGLEHAHTAYSLSSLALLYHNQGKYMMAEPFYQQALSVLTRVYGPDHPHTADCIAKLADFYYDQEKYARAEPYYQWALEVWEKSVGPDHPNTADCLLHYAMLLRDVGRPREADILSERARAAQEAHRLKNEQRETQEA